MRRIFLLLLAALLDGLVVAGLVRGRQLVLVPGNTGSHRCGAEEHGARDRVRAHESTFDGSAGYVTSVPPARTNTRRRSAIVCSGWP